MRSSRSHPWLLSFLGVLGVIFATLVAVPAQADDASGNPIVFDKVSFEKTDFEDGFRQAVSVEWHVDGNPTTAPVEIDLPLPSWLHGEADFFTLRGDGGEDIGSCTITQGNASCTVTDADYVSARPLDFSGQFRFFVASERGNDATETVDETIGGHDFTFTVTPRQNGGGGVCDDCEYERSEPEKFGQYLRASEPGEVDRIRWVVRVGDVPAGTQPGEVSSMGAPIDEGKVIELTDTGVIDGMTVVSTRVTGADTVRKGADGIEVLNFEEVPASDLTWAPDFTTVSWTAGHARDGDLGQNQAGEAIRGLGGTVYEVEWTVTLDDDGAAGAYYNTASYTVDGRSTGALSTVAQRGGGSGSAVGTNEGQLRITKAVDGDAVFAPAPTFTVTVQAYDPDGTLIGTESADIADGESFLTNRYRTGTRLVVTETAPVDPSNVDWTASIEDEASGGSSDTFSYEVVLGLENRNVGRVSALTLTNTATLQMGAFSATKRVVNPDGLAVDGDSRYVLDYEWDADGTRGIPAGAGTLEVSADGVAVTSDPIPVGAVVRVTERSGAAVNGGHWQTPVISPAEFRVTPGASVSVEVTNELVRAYGGFSVTKELSGTGTVLVPDDQTFTVRYSFPAVNGHPGGSGSVQVRANGVPVVVGDIPAGAVVTLSEDAPDAVTDADWQSAVFSTNEVTIVEGQIAEVTLENTVEAVPGDSGEETPPNEDTPPTGQQLAVTGGALVPGLLAVPLLLIVLGFALVRPRRQQA